MNVTIESVVAAWQAVCDAQAEARVLAADYKKPAKIGAAAWRAANALAVEAQALETAYERS